MMKMRLLSVVQDFVVHDGLSPIGMMSSQPLTGLHQANAIPRRLAVQIIGSSGGKRCFVSDSDAVGCRLRGRDVRFGTTGRPRVVFHYPTVTTPLFAPCGRWHGRC
jgi:hypothetical protein